MGNIRLACTLDAAPEQSAVARCHHFPATNEQMPQPGVMDVTRGVLGWLLGSDFDSASTSE